PGGALQRPGGAGRVAGEPAELPPSLRDTRPAGAGGAGGGDLHGEGGGGHGRGTPARGDRRRHPPCPRGRCGTSAPRVSVVVREKQRVEPHAPRRSTFPWLLRAARRRWASGSASCRKTISDPSVF